jgi:hypothetical protein
MDPGAVPSGEMMVTILVALVACVAVWAFFRWFDKEVD